ncbi:glycoside hydrolase family 73 protein [Capnocytophaga sputigena]|jgi:mannosyl-glycoproteinendo-beta-N-acetylglucosami dase|uniref:glycoside hydrolase family 73 protein n=1 Tax=Capnocytophaga sputigena TaxID=1019 RepID=UPI000F6F52BB|nr:glucosaminidase domain-containing protein [Capnocytophaga sputigena]VEI53864.1 Peptidoglycan hydrolase flgJ [Capnocytophaga sputigena]DAJ53015.1 MAG TPA: Muramidase (flagellum-specific) [Caudoviricetes sp.]DAN07121.1 MAG TPA: Muramidase (flagellum-specific) [Caudoviricetes sp.]DAX79477.1 MAG TPA: Muramidase (flagellum-specific) [Caudoviricetes sp.]
MTPKEFIKQYKPFALETERKTGISHLFILAQAALESFWGKKSLGNMFFGVKAGKDTPTNKKQLLTTTEILSSPNLKHLFPLVISVNMLPSGKYKYEVKDWFRKYDTPEECFTDHAQFFFKNKRYAKALEVKTDPYKFAEEVAKAGYATATNYADSLKKIIKMLKSYE